MTGAGVGVGVGVGEGVGVGVGGEVGVPAVGEGSGVGRGVDVGLGVPEGVGMAVGAGTGDIAGAPVDPAVGLGEGNTTPEGTDLNGGEGFKTNDELFASGIPLIAFTATSAMIVSNKIAAVNATARVRENARPRSGVGKGMIASDRDATSWLFALRPPCLPILPVCPDSL